MKIKSYFIFFLFFLFALKAEAAVTINFIATPVGDCPSPNPREPFCDYKVVATGISGNDNTIVVPGGWGYFQVVLIARYESGSFSMEYSVPISIREGSVNDIAKEAMDNWGNREVVVRVRDYDGSDPLVKMCLTVRDNGYFSRPEFGNECGSADPGPGPEPDPGSCDLGGPYYLSHGSMDVYDVNGNEARVNLNVTCTQDATLTFTAPNQLDLGQNIVSQLTLDGQKPDGLKLDFSAPGRTLLFASKLQTIGTPETGTFDKVYLLQATIQ